MVKFAILLHTIYKCLCVVVVVVALDSDRWAEPIELRSRFVLRTAGGWGVGWREGMGSEGVVMATTENTTESV